MQGGWGLFRGGVLNSTKIDRFMRAYYSDQFVLPLPAGHRFPMPKFGRVYQTLIRDGVAGLDQFHCPEIAGRDVLAHARVLKLGRVLAVGDVLMTSEGASAPVARAGLTYSIPPKIG